MRQTHRVICRLAAGAGDILQQQQHSAHPLAAAVLLQLQRVSAASPGHTTISSAAVSSSNSSSSSSSLISRRSGLLLSQGRSLAAVVRQQPWQQQQWRGLTVQLQEMQQEQQRLSGQQQQQAAGANQRTQFERLVLAVGSIEHLDALLGSHPDPQPREVTVALSMLGRLHKAHRVQLKQHVKSLQQRWACLRPLDEEQSQQRAELEQQHAQHQQQLLAVLGKLVDKLHADSASLTVDQLVQVLGCFGTFGCVQHMPNGSQVLLLALQRTLEGVQSLQPRQLTYIATSLAQLQDAERGERALDDQQDDTAAPTSSSDSSDSSSSSVRAQQGRQSEQQQAVAELSRLLVLELCNAVQQCGSLLDAPGVANFVAAMGRLNHYDWQTMRYVGTIALRHTQAFTPDQVAKVLTGFTKLRHYDQELCARLADAAARVMPQASGVRIAQTMWALAHQRYEQAAVFEAAALQVPDTVHEMQPRHVANLSWAFAVRKAYSPKLYDALAERMVELIAQDRTADSSSSSSSSSSGSSSGSIDSLFVSPNDVVLPHHLSLVAWSFAKQGHKHEAMMQAIGDRAAQLAAQMLPQNVSNAAWAFGSLGVSHTALFGALAAAAKACKLEGYNNQNITDLAWGAAQAGHTDEELFGAIAAATSNSLHELSPHSLSDLIWAFANTRPPQANQVLEAAVPAVVDALPRLNMQMLADVLYSYAVLGIKDEGMLKAVAEVLPMRMAALEADTDAQAKIIWTMKELEWRDDGLERVLGGLIPNLAELLSA